MPNSEALKRWRDIVGYGAIGGMFPLVTPYRDLPAGLQSRYGLILVIGGAIGILVALHHWIGFRLQHLKQLRYPSFVVSVPLALIVGYLISGANHRGAPGGREYLAAGLIYVATVCGAAALHPRRQIGPVPAELKDDNPRIENLYKCSDTEFLKWIRREKPIGQRSEDLFGALPRARLLRNLLVRDPTTTLGVIGPFGVGKTSIIELLRSELKETNVLLCSVSCWGFEDSSAAQESTLAQALEFLSEQADCFAIRGLPARYTAALSKTSTYLEAVLAVLGPNRDPVEQLRRFTPILAALKATLLIALEDADRNGSRFDIHHIEGLLHRFRGVPGISFIITANPASTVDFVRLCDHTVYVGNLPPDQSLRTISRVRYIARQLYPSDHDPVDRSGLLEEEVLDPSFQAWMAELPPWPVALGRLLATPRLLKATARRFHTAWEHLHGEVDIDELLVLCCLRTCAPSAFAFVTKWIEPLRQSQRSRSNPGDGNWDHIAKAMQGDWKSMEEDATYDTSSATILIQAILPASQNAFELKSYSKIKAVQTIKTAYPTDYWSRIFSENPVEIGVLDQTVFKAILKANESDDGADLLAKSIGSSDEFARIFEHFADLLQSSRLLPLNSRLYSYLRQSHGRSANRDNTGFVNLWRFTRKKVSPDDMVSWLLGEIRASIPTNIRLATDLFHYWAHEWGEAHRDRLRTAVVESVRAHFAGSNAQELVAGLDEAYPYTLSHLVAGSNEQPDVSLTNPEDWHWFALTLVAAARLSPVNIVPQLAVYLNKARSEPDAPIDFQFDEARVNGLFGEQQESLMQLLAAPIAVPETLPHRLRRELELLRQRAAEWLTRK
jgi:hypothetical protein